jgi:hypothetical protein
MAFGFVQVHHPEDRRSPTSNSEHDRTQQTARGEELAWAESLRWLLHAVRLHVWLSRSSLSRRSCLGTHPPFSTRFFLFLWSLNVLESCCYCSSGRGYDLLVARRERDVIEGLRPSRSKVSSHFSSCFQSESSFSCVCNVDGCVFRRDLVPIISALEYNTWFKKFRASGLRLNGEALDRLLVILRKSLSIEEIYLDNAGLKT